MSRVGQMRHVSDSVRPRGTGIVVFTFAALVLFALPASAAAVSGRYTVTALVSNTGVPRPTADARLVNARGLVPGPGPPRWVSGHGAAFATLYNATWAALQTSGGFVDSKIPAGYAPFGIQTIGARIFVTFAKQGAGAKDELDGQGLGFVDAFDTDGNLLVRVAQHGQLNAPWGLALAPASFGRFGGDLLVGNFV